MERYLLLFISIIFIRMAVSAQSEADVNVSRGGYGLVKTNINLNYDYGWGTINDAFSTRVSYEFLRNKNFTLTANARYTSTELSFHENDLSNSFIPDEINLNGTHLFGQIGVTSTYKTTLFGRPIMGMAMINSEWSEGGFARISGIAMGIVMLRANQRSVAEKMPFYIYIFQANDKV